MKGTGEKPGLTINSCWYKGVMEVAPEVKVGVKDSNTNGSDRTEPEATMGIEKLVTKELRNRNWPTFN